MIVCFIVDHIKNFILFGRDAILSSYSSSLPLASLVIGCISIGLVVGSKDKISF